jgi:cell division protein FtsA
MPRSTIVTGIDIGTHHVKAVVAERQKGKRGLPHVIGSGLGLSKGLRHGYIINSSDAVRSIRAAVSGAEKASGEHVKRAYLSVGGISLEGIAASGSTMVARGDSEISELDIKAALEASEHAIPQSLAINRKIIHAIPLQYKIDGKEVLGRPLGMKGSRLEAKTLFITTLEQHLNDLIQAVEDAGVEVLDVMASPLATSLVSLTQAQKIAGCALVNIGAETVSIVVFENNIPISLQVFPIGSTDITNDIALGFKIPLEEAEAIKIGAITETDYPKKRLDEIVTARLSDIFDLIEAHLKKIGRSGLLPAGIVITGGGSSIASIEDLAKAALQLPARVAIPNIANTTGGEIRDVSWSVAYGLCVWGFSAIEGEPMGIRIAKQTKHKLMEWIKQFLP